MKNAALSGHVEIVNRWRTSTGPSAGAAACATAGQHLCWISVNGPGIGAKEMVLDNNATNDSDLPVPIDAEFWERVLGTGWERRGAFVAAMIASRYRFHLSEDHARDIFGEALRRCVRKFGGPDTVPRNYSQVGTEPPEPELVLRRLLRGFVHNCVREFIARAKARPADFTPGCDPANVSVGQPVDHDGVMDLVRRVGAGLTPRQNKILYLFYLSHKTQTAIATDLDISVATVNREVERIRLAFYEYCRVAAPGRGSVRD